MVRYTDTLLAALHERLVALGTWDDTTVIVTADHGSSFTPGGTFRYWTEDASPEITGVPLLVHGPDFAADAVVDTPTQSVDIVPTIAAVTGVESPWAFDGANLLDLPTEPRVEHPYALGATDDRDYAVTTIDVSEHLERLLALRPARGTDGGGDLAILQSGPNGDLIGSSIAAYRRSDATDEAGTYEQRFPDAPRPGGSFTRGDDGRVPAYLIVDLDGPEADDVILATVDGRIAGTTWAFRGEAGGIQAAIMLPPAWLATGDHEVALWTYDDDAMAARPLNPEP